MITPQKIQELSEPVESIYTACVNELMVNIGKHITAPTWTHTAAWEVQKLSEMGQLTQENAAIINKWIKQVTPEMRKTMEFTRREALKKLEKQMEKAAEQGYVTPPLVDSTVQVMNDYLGQATDRLNLVNTTMLQSSISQYSKAVNLTADIMARESATLTALNVAAGSVVTGTETRTKAVRRAIDTISKEGITGFYDRSGRSWTPEAYVNMVVRTTVHNTAIQSVKSRMQDYGTDVFQISSHAGARPRCYPYQGWFCSWSNTSGDIELGDGRTVRYRPLSDTSYGEPAGIFGINCGHYPIPIIAGLTIPHGEDNIQPKEENDKAYAESQQQRALERQIRAAKRTIEMGDNSPEAKQKLKEQQQKMRQFIKETGRTRRYDRESLMGGAQTSQKLNSQPATPTPKKDYSATAVESRIKNNGFAQKVFLPSNMPDEMAREIESVVGKLHDSGYPTIRGLAYDAKACAQQGAAAFYDRRTDTIYIGKRFLNTPSEFERLFAQSAENYAKEAESKQWRKYGERNIASGTEALKNAKSGYDKFNANTELKSGYYLTGISKQSTVCKTVADVLTHEFGHAMHLRSGVNVKNTKDSSTTWNVNTTAKSLEPYKAASELGAYALKNPLEAVAEAFAERQKGGTVPSFYLDVWAEIDGKVKQ